MPWDVPHHTGFDWFGHGIAAGTAILMLVGIYFFVRGIGQILDDQPKDESKPSSNKESESE